MLKYNTEDNSVKMSYIINPILRSRIKYNSKGTGGAMKCQHTQNSMLDCVLQ